MPKSRTHKRHNKHKRTNRGLIKNLRRTIPAVASGLKTVGSKVKNITVKSTPIVEKGIGSLYNGVLTGFDLGVKGVKKGVNLVKMNNSSKTRRHR